MALRGMTGCGRGRRAPSRSLAGWLRAAVAGAVVAGLAGTTSLIAASMLARLTRGAGVPGQAAGPRLGGPPGPPHRLR